MIAISLAYNVSVLVKGVAAYNLYFITNALSCQFDSPTSVGMPGYATIARQLAVCPVAKADMSSSACSWTALPD
jgi:hypothetical protein